jgi:uncharacterized iron-regulated membrane protein
MTLGERWLRRPRSLWVRKALFQIHLWTGIGAGLYVLFICVSGSAIVFRNELYSSLGTKPPIVAASGERLTSEGLKQAARKAYPGYGVNYVWQSKNPNQAVEIWMDRGGHKRQRLFNPYTGQDLGDSVPYSIQVLAWLKELHLNLLAGETGRAVNGVGAILMTALALTGAILWWPGIRTWRSSLTLQRRTSWKRFNWDLHSAVGFWTLAFVFMWGFVGIYAAFPVPFQKAINSFAPLREYRLDPLPASLEKSADVKFVPVADEPPQAKGKRRIPRRNYSFGDQIVRWFSFLHFGNFAGWRVKALWTILGLAPPFLFVTGVLMWWNRVLSPGARRSRRRTEVAAEAPFAKSSG